MQLVRILQPIRLSTTRAGGRAFAGKPAYFIEIDAWCVGDPDPVEWVAEKTRIAL
jgi:hypothetical protein